MNGALDVSPVYKHRRPPEPLIWVDSRYRASGVVIRRPKEALPKTAGGDILSQEGAKDAKILSLLRLFAANLCHYQTASALVSRARQGV